MNTTDETRGAWGKQHMYDEAIVKRMAQQCKLWGRFASGTKLSPFDQNQKFEAVREASIVHDALVLDTYARSYINHLGLSQDLEMPTLEKLAQWIHEDECPDAEKADSEERLTEFYAERTRWHTLSDSIGTVLFIKVGGPEPFNLLGWLFGLDATGGIDLRRLGDLFIKRNKRGPRLGRHPLAPLMKAWFATRPRPASASDRGKDRILPAQVAMAPPGDRRASKLFSVAAHIEDRLDSETVMPGFQVDRQAPALPLALYDLGLGALENKARNPAAPLALRLWVASILLTNQQDRHGNHPVAFETPLRRLLAELYPGRTPRPNEYWPRLMKAIEDLDSFEARVPWYDPETKRGGLRRVVSVGDIPRGPGALNDFVRIVVDLPPGSENGPQVSDNLALWGVKSDRAYRALLNLAYWWHNPGVTTRPVGKRADGQGDFWAMSSNPAHYPEMSDAQMVQIVFPTSAQKQRRNLVGDAKRVLRELQRAGEIDIINGKPVPALKPDRPTS